MIPPNVPFSFGGKGQPRRHYSEQTKASKSFAVPSVPVSFLYSRLRANEMALSLRLNSIAISLTLNENPMIFMSHYSAEAYALTISST